jgi:excisionase family DNA binding protein
MAHANENNGKLAYSISEACRATSLGRTSIYAYIKSKQLEIIKVGGRTLIPARALHDFLLGDGK